MDSIERGALGHPLPCANLINAPLQFGQTLDQHRNYLTPPGFSTNDFLAYYRRPNCYIADFRDRQHGTMHVLAETTRAIPAYGECLAGYPVETHTNPRASHWLISNSVFNWIDSSPHCQAQRLVHCVAERQYEVEDVAILAFDFMRRDYRSGGHQEVHRSVWVYYFIGEYLRVVHNFPAQQHVDSYWGHFLVRPEVQAFHMWSELHEIGYTMTN